MRTRGAEVPMCSQQLATIWVLPSAPIACESVKGAKLTGERPISGGRVLRDLRIGPE